MVGYLFIFPHSKLVIIFLNVVSCQRPGCPELLVLVVLLLNTCMIVGTDSSICSGSLLLKIGKAMISYL